MLVGQVDDEVQEDRVYHMSADLNNKFVTILNLNGALAVRHDKDSARGYYRSILPSAHTHSQP